MAVDSLRDTFHINRVKAEEIGLLISAQSYRAEITRAIRDIKSLKGWKRLQEICSNKIAPGPHPKYGLSGHPCLKTRNVMGLIASDEDVDWVPVAKGLESFFVQDEDILLNLTGAGSIGRVSIYFGDHQPLTNQHIARLSIKKPYDSAYVCSFLASWWGERAIEQGISGSTGQLNLVNDHVRALPIFLPNLEAQTYIGDKVRQAGRLRERSKRINSRIKNYFDSLLLSPLNFNPSKRHSRVHLDKLTHRLNAEFYSEKFTSVEESLQKKFTKVISLGEIAPTVRTKIRPKQSCTYREISDIDTSIGIFRDGNFYSLKDVPNNAQRHFDFGDIAVSTRRPNRGAIAVILNSSDTDFYSVFLARLKPKNLSQAYWIKEYLRHEVGRSLLEQRCTWTTYPVISEDDLETVPLPYDPEGWDKIGSLSSISIQLMELSSALTIAAKFLVEALIEGNLKESELKAAQEKLQQGDDSLDREILSHLTRKGYNVSGEPPLFPDLDALYEVLKKAETSQEVE
jgi:type I restriction enzyme S subunit